MTDGTIRAISLRANGYRFDGLAAGPESGELVLFLHGFPQFADAWAELLETVGAWNYHAVAVDQRGYSPDARPVSVDDYGVDELSSDALAFADFFGARRFHIVGHDWGGAVAWTTAADAPDRLKTLTVLSTPHPAALLSARQSDADQQRRSAYVQLLQAPSHAAEKALLADNAALLRGAYMGKMPTVQIETNVLRFEQDGTLTAALNWYRAGGRSKPRGPVAVPTLYIWGDQDQALGETAALDTAAHCTGRFRFERLNGKSHWLMEECPLTILALLRDHIGAAGDDRRRTR